MSQPYPRYLRHWRTEDIEEMYHAKTFTELNKVAMRVLAKTNIHDEQDKPVAIVCGPITTGGFGSREKNLQVFKDTIDRLLRDGINVFNQMPFEHKMLEVMTKLKESSLDLSDDVIGHTLLNEFYLPLFESGHIRRFYFIPGWETSLGATWEHEQAKRLKRRITYLTKI